MLVNIRLVALVFLLAPNLVGPVSAQAMVSDAPMYVDKGIVDNAVNSKGHATLAAAMQATGVVDILKALGPFAALPARLIELTPK